MCCFSFRSHKPVKRPVEKPSIAQTTITNAYRVKRGLPNDWPWSHIYIGRKFVLGNEGIHMQRHVQALAKKNGWVQKEIDHSFAELCDRVCAKILEAEKNGMV